MSTTSNLAQALGDLDEAAVVREVENGLAAGTAPLEILDQLQAGMAIVGQRFENDEYFLSELIFAADIFKKANAPLAESLKGQARHTVGTMVLGTVKNDIHDFGKDIVATVMSSNGIKIIDLGVNVDYERFVEAIKEHKPDFVGLSCLLTTVFDDMKATVDTIAQAGLRDQVKVLVGGGPVDQSVADYVGADMYCSNAQEAVDAAKTLLGVR